MKTLYARALVPIGIVMVVLLMAGGAAVALLGGGGVAGSERPASDIEEVLFEVGDAGTVLVRSDGQSLSVIEATASPSWSFEVGSSGGDNVGVSFADRAMAIGFEAVLEDGVVVGTIKIRPPSPSTAGEEATEQLGPRIADADGPARFGGEKKLPSIAAEPGAPAGAEPVPLMVTGDTDLTVIPAFDPPEIPEETSGAPSS